MIVKYVIKRKKEEIYQSQIPWDQADNIFDAQRFDTLEQAIDEYNILHNSEWEICVVTVNITKSSDIVYGKYNKASRK